MRNAKCSSRRRRIRFFNGDEMIDKEEFLKMMSEISEQKERNEAFSRVLSDCCDNIVNLNSNKNLDALLILAKETIDPDEWINWLFFDNCNFEIGTGENKIIVDTPEKLYDYLETEYSFSPKMISLQMFLEIIELQKQQDETNHALVNGIDNCIDCQYAIPSDSYHTALMRLIANTFDFYETYSYWLYEDGKSVGLEGCEYDISTPEKLYEFICLEFEQCGGVKPKKIIDSNANAITQEELFELMKQQILKTQK